MTPQEFVEKWKRAQLSERASCQEHFIDLCNVLGQPTPATADPDGEWYTFERGVKTAGGHGWADVWMKNRFGWEYKRKHRDLKAAYKQLQLYREDLGNPPLLVVCDTERFEVHTNFTGTAKKVYKFDLDGLTMPSNLGVLRKLFVDPDGLKPVETAAGITEMAARQFGSITEGMLARGVEPLPAAHFAMKLMFCMFGEDIELLPDDVFTGIVNGGRKDTAKLTAKLRALFRAMAKGGDFGPIDVPYFNGGLFDDDEAFELTRDEVDLLIDINGYDWSSVEPSIFGTLFERTLDPDKRTQIGAHYTSRDDIVALLEPVIMTPLRREWEAVRAKCDALWEKLKEVKPRARKTLPKKPGKASNELARTLQTFLEYLAHVTILDPACGSGNFLYVAINLLLDLEKEVIAYGATRGTAVLPQVRPTQLAGIEINPYAQQLAQVVIWIGYLQWKYANGFTAPRDPILEPIESIQLMDAIVDLADPERPRVPRWPPAEFIVGNPPFLGGKLLRANLGDEYVDSLFNAWDDRVPREADLCCYWFEKAREQIAIGRCHRAGLLATQGIRGGANRKVLEKIKTKGDIFFAVSDRDWILDGANVHISMVGFDNGTEEERVLDGSIVATINANLTASVNLTIVKKLRSNKGISFQGPVKVGEFEMDDAAALSLLSQPNPNGLPTSDVVRPWINGVGITSREPPMWIIDFVERDMAEASGYGAAFERVKALVKPERDKTKRERRRRLWWMHGEVNNK